MKKTLEFHARFDTQDFDRSIDMMRQKLRDLYAPQDLVRAQAQTAAKLNQLGLGVSGPGQAQQQQAAIKYRRELDTYMKDEYRKQEDLVKLLTKRDERLNSLKEKQKEVSKGSEEEFKIRDKIVRLEDGQLRRREVYRHREQALNQAAQAKASMQGSANAAAMQQYLQGGGTRAFAGGGGGGGGTPGGASGGAQGGGGFLSGIGLGGAFKIGGAMSAAGIGLANIGEYLAGRNMRLESARGAAVKGTAGQDLSQVYAGRAPFESAFMPERGQASAMAGQKAEASRYWDAMKGRSGIAMIVAGIGAAVLSGGTALPMLLGGLAAAGTGTGLLVQDKTREQLLGNLPDFMGGAEHRDRYSQLLAAQQAKDFRQVLEDLKEQDPQKKMVVEEFEQNYQRNLQLQRTLGMTNKGFYGSGGFLERAKDAGFTADQAIQMGQQIVGSGGSARMGGQAQFGLQMQRQGITNAPQMLGALGGAMQSPEAAKSASIAIISEAFKIGLDNSDYVEETRRFAQSASEVLSRTGAVRGEDQDRLLRMLGMFTGERTVTGMQAGRTAFESFQERGSQMSGRRGVMRFAEARKDPNIGRLQGFEMTEFLAMRPEDFESNPALLAYFSERTGLSSDQLIDKRRKLQGETRFQIPQARKMAANFSGVLKQYMGTQNVDLPELARRSRAGALPPEIQRAVGGLGLAMNMEEAGGVNQQRMFADMGELLGKGGVLTDKEKEATKSLFEGTTGRIEDDFVRKIAESVDTVRENFNKLKEVLELAAASTSRLTEGANSAADALHGVSGRRRAGMASDDPMNNPLLNLLRQGASQQPQSNRPKGK